MISTLIKIKTLIGQSRVFTVLTESRRWWKAAFGALEGAAVSRRGENLSNPARFLR